MLIEGAVLGTMTLGAFALTYSRLPKGMKTWVVKHPVLTDVIMVVFFYAIMGMSVTSHVACAFMALEAQGLLHIAKNKDEYQFIFDLVDKGKELIAEGFAKLREYNAECQAKKVGATSPMTEEK